MPTSRYLPAASFSLPVPRDDAKELGVLQQAMAVSQSVTTTLVNTLYILKIRRRDGNPSRGSDTLGTAAVSNLLRPCA